MVSPAALRGGIRRGAGSVRCASAGGDTHRHTEAATTHSVVNHAVIKFVGNVILVVEWSKWKRGRVLALWPHN